MASCDGCGALHFERWPKGVLTAKCSDVPERMWLTPGGERVIAYAANGAMGQVDRPAWCKKGDAPQALRASSPCRGARKETDSNDLPG